MVAKVRKQIYLDVQQNKILKEASQKLGVSEAEIIRQAIMSQTHRLQASHRDIQAWENERQFIDALIEQGTVAGGRTWKREDLYERKFPG